MATQSAKFPLLTACRPRQWTKNLLVFAAPLFAFELHPQAWVSAGIALICFCAISSATYLLNDTLDLESDRKHPTKCHRPIASGLVSVPLALSTALILTLASLGIASQINLLLFGVIFAYGLVQVGYCLILKRQPLLDLFCIASGFLLRAISGGVAANIRLSPWFLLTVGLLALFLAIEKRKAELRVSLERGVVTRKVLQRYSLPLLMRLENIVSTSTFMSYSLWAAGPALKGASTSWMLLTVPFVLIGIFRYQLLSDPQEAHRRAEKYPDKNTEKPEEILLEDRGIQLTMLVWLICVISIGLFIK